jgi:hypothetical protein
MFKLGLLAMIPLFLLACGGSDGQESVFFDGDGDVHGREVLFRFTSHELSDAISQSDAIVVVEVSGIQGSQAAGPLPLDIVVQNPNDQERYDRFAAAAAAAPVATTYRGTVETWIKGSGSSTVEIRGAGGVTSEGERYFFDGHFLLEPGRKYLLLLTQDDRGAYWYGHARGGYDVTDGVKVMNHPDTRDLEEFEKMSVAELVNYVKELADTVTPGQASG